MEQSTHHTESTDYQVTEELPEVSFDEFEIPTYEEWKTAVEGLLKGKPFDKSMFTKTYEGILLHPIYRLEDQEGLSHPHSYTGRATKISESATTTKCNSTTLVFIIKCTIINNGQN